MQQLVGRKTITTMQDGGVYKEIWRSTWNDPYPDDGTAITEFFDSAGASLLTINGTVEPEAITFLEQPETVQDIPNGAGFRVIVTDEEGPHVIRYGTVFRRQLTFPHSPAEVSTFEPKRYTDTFQRPPGPIGGRWKNLVGRAMIFQNVFTTFPNSVGPDFNFFNRYFARYYQPFNGDSVELSVSCIDKGAGQTVIPICCNADGTSYLYVQFNSLFDNVDIGFGTGPDVGFGLGFLESQDGPTALTVPFGTMVNFKLRYDDATKELAFYNDDYTIKYLSWVDEDEIVPHGKGYRYFGIAGQAGALFNGVELTYISAANVVA